MLRHLWIVTAIFTVDLMEEVKIMQHNVMSWTHERSIELGNYYGKEQPTIILLNATSKCDCAILHVFKYNVVQRNAFGELLAGVAIRKDLKYKIIDDFTGDILGTEMETAKGPLMILTCYCTPRRNYVLTGEIENKLKREFLSIFWVT